MNEKDLFPIGYTYIVGKHIFKVHKKGQADNAEIRMLIRDRMETEWLTVQSMLLDMKDPTFQLIEDPSKKYPSKEKEEEKND